MLLKNYEIICHKDIEIENTPVSSSYYCPIQAGAALTGKRICMLNDYDNFPESISDRNERYSEATAMFYISKHIESDYIGISHYRRHLIISDSDFEKLASKSVDIITSYEQVYTLSVENLYRQLHYSADWDLFTDILKEMDSEDFEFDKYIFSQKTIHIANLHIYKSSLYKAFCDWAFPILDVFYTKSPVKTDVYQKRDVGFIAERLSHLFIMKMLRDGKQIIEVPIIELPTTPIEISLDNPEDVLSKCEQFYESRRFMMCSNLIDQAVDNNNMISEELIKLHEIFHYYKREMVSGQTMTLFEYLPIELRDTVRDILKTFDTLKKMVSLYNISRDEILTILQDYLDFTGFSELITGNILQNIAGKTDYKSELLKKLHFKNYNYNKGAKI